MNVRYFPHVAVTVTILSLCLCAEVLAQAGKETVPWNDALDQPSAWYASDEAVRIADNVLLYQGQSGGWPKNIDMARIFTEVDKDRIGLEQAKRGPTPNNITIDKPVASSFSS